MDRGAWQAAAHRLLDTTEANCACFSLLSLTRERNALKHDYCPILSRNSEGVREKDKKGERKKCPQAAGERGFCSTVLTLCSTPK